MTDQMTDQTTNFTNDNALPGTASVNSVATRTKLELLGVNKIKVKLVGEMALANDSPGFDPYNSTGGQTAQVPWRRREDRR